MASGAFAVNSANQYVDNVLQSSLEQELLSANLLPARLPGFTKVLSNTKYRNGVTKVDFTFSSVIGLHRIKRKGDCSGPKSYKGEISINCTLILFPLQSVHRTVIKNSTYTSVGKVEAAATEVLVDLQIVGRPQNYLGILKKFDVGSLDIITPIFSNIPTHIINHLLDLQKTYQRHTLDNLYSILYQKYADAVGRAFSKMPMPR
ncbi:uncharacterized protein LOC129976515 [Argiope bruennichi]|uniref:Uncharacterized protein n=1 Tax=Argiope bruennichi TaxID=94029 RepID=A0A8T0EM07_ARGBR|nr:uncharacterized protein LOC129976515 [Argiope bruennichi]KAF8776892.1 hypothetical protein HNY73_013830 [Argiope bruennichi]